MSNEKEIPDKLNILYQPDLDYDKHYDSEGDIDDVDESEDIENSEDEASESLQSDIVDEIKTISTLLPEDMKDIINSPLAIIETLYDEIKDITDKPIIKEEFITTEEVTSNDNKSDIPEVFFRDDDDPFIITVKNKDKLTTIKEIYDYDLACIITDYTNKLKDSLNNYISSVLMSFKNLDVSMYSKILDTYNLSTDKVSDDYKHLSDLIIRSQITRQMNMRLYNRLFSIDKTISHIRACKIGVEQRLRYYSAEYQSESSFNDFVSNRFLENSRMMYDEKYKQNFFNLYKYLNSSVILINECFKLLINEAQAKIILIEKEGTDLW